MSSWRIYICISPWHLDDSLTFPLKHAVYSAERLLKSYVCVIAWHICMPNSVTSRRLIDLSVGAHQASAERTLKYCVCMYTWVRGKCVCMSSWHLCNSLTMCSATRPSKLDVHMCMYEFVTYIYVYMRSWHILMLRTHIYIISLSQYVWVRDIYSCTHEVVAYTYVTNSYIHTYIISLSHTHVQTHVHT